jgi:hypothetical protein
MRPHATLGTVVEKAEPVADGVLRRALLDGLAGGLISATAVIAVGLILMDADWGSPAGPITVLLMTILATTAALALRRVLAHRHCGRIHVLVPPLLAVLIPIGVAAGGPIRDRYETTAIWAAIAVLAHLTLAALAQPRLRAGLRIAATVGLATACLATVLVERGCQRRWRAGDFQAVGVPLIAPELPGFELTGAYPGRYRVLLVLTARSGPLALSTVEVGVETSPPAGSLGSCAGRTEQPFVVQVPGSMPSGVFCLRDGTFRMWLHPGPAAASIEPLLDQVTVRPVPASKLANLPDPRTDPKPG